MASRRKNLLEYAVLSVFILCIGLAMSAALEFTTVARERLYLLQGAILLLTAASAIALLALLRLCQRIKERIDGRTTNGIEAVGFALLLCAAFLLRYFVIVNITLEPESDFETYYRLGSLLSQNQMQTVEGQMFREYVAQFPHAIGFPMMVLAPVFRTFGVSVRAGLYANLALSLGTVVFVFAAARRLWGKTCGLMAMLLAAVWPSHVLYSSMLASEPSFTFMITGGMLLVAYIFDKGENSIRERRPVLCVVLVVALGLLLGVANGIRPMALILVIAVCTVFLVSGEHSPISRGGARQILSKGWLCALIVFLSYSLISMVITQTVYSIIRVEPVGGLTASGYNLLVGSNAKNKGVWNQEDADFFVSVFNETGSASAAHRASMEKALKRISDNPEDTLDLFVFKFRDLWQSDDFGIDWNLLWAEQQGVLTPQLESLLEAVRPVGRQLYFFVLTLIAIGALRQWRRSGPIDPAFFVMSLFFLGTALLHMLLETQVRYHYNMLPFLMLLGVYGFSGWLIPSRAAAHDGLGEPEPDLPGAPSPIVKSQPQSFDISEAIRSGHIKVVVSEASASKPMDSDRPQ